MGGSNKLDGNSEGRYRIFSSPMRIMNSKLEDCCREQCHYCTVGIVQRHTDKEITAKYNPFFQRHQNIPSTNSYLEKALVSQRLLVE
jgi:hypothetical protein